MLTNHSRPARPVLILSLISFLLLAWLLSASQASDAATLAATPAIANDWQRVWKGDGAIYALAARDANTLVGVGSEGMILSSNNGGETWHYQAPVPNSTLFDLTLVGLNVWAVGENGQILYSGDGGSHWR
ncbi:MAG: hypothetical protein GXP38_12955, partial [Chloroflexi bacterium]|nr:hypothetical protein [Chloroflexota bacterium]